VNNFGRSLTMVAAAMVSHSGTSLAAEDPATDVPVNRDLTAVIALQGLPCGQVVSATQQGEDEYLASCQDGNRYRVFVDADGRVVVEKLD
jgi:aminoglycoside phosphotransferase